MGTLALVRPHLRALGAAALVIGIGAAALAVPVGASTVGAGTELRETGGTCSDIGIELGSSTAVSGVTALFGDPCAQTWRGAVQLFTDGSGGWQHTQTLRPPHSTLGANFGSAVAISGSMAVIGAPDLMRVLNGQRYFGGAYVFRRTKFGWVADGTLLTPEQTYAFGATVAISGDTIAVGGATVNQPANANPGRVWIFTHTAAGWSQTAELDESAQAFGDSVSLSGGNLVVGAPDQTQNTGWAYVFHDADGRWRESALLKAADAHTEDLFGQAVSISGGTIIVGAPMLFPSTAGKVYVFRLSSGGWKQAAEFHNSPVNLEFGLSVAAGGNEVVVGAPSFNAAVYAIDGRVYVFSESGGTWTRTLLRPGDAARGDYFGFSVALSGDAVAVGAPGWAHSGGRGYLFDAPESG